MSIKNVVFDFGGVLLDWNPRYLFRDAFKDDVKMEYFLSHVCTPQWNAQTDRGVSFDDAIAPLIAQFPQYEDMIRLYKSGWPKMLKGEIPEGVQLLKDVKNSGKYTLYGLTNWSAETFPYAFNRYRFLDDFEGIVVSGEEKIAKPDKGLFMVLFDRYHLNPEECAFIDDSPANIATAKERGMHAVLAQDLKEGIKNLRSLLKLD